MLGKRKRNVEFVVKRSQKSDDSSLTHLEQSDNDVHEVFKRHFETTFTTLPQIEKQSPVDETELSDEFDDDETEVSDWSGFSEVSEDNQEVVVVDHTHTIEQQGNGINRIFQKAFMSSKPPRQPDNSKMLDNDVRTEEDGEERLNVKHDLELQRLLKESHLLEQSKAVSDPGLVRQKALDLRLQDLGAKASLFTQEKMPFAHRKGIAGKAAQRESKRRQHAKENGIILERAVKKQSPPSRSRSDRGVDVPAVGKFQSGTLKLSRKDVLNIQGSRTAAKRNGRR